MPKIQLTTIAGKQVIDPDEPQLSHEIFQVPWKDWYRSIYESAILEVLLSDDEHAARKSHAAGKPPTLVIAQPNADDFLLSWFEDNREWVPYNGEPCDAFSVYDSGGEQFRMPDACLVEPAAALRIALSFVRTLTRDPETHWIPRCDLPVDDAFWEPM